MSGHHRLLQPRKHRSAGSARRVRADGDHLHLTGGAGHGGLHLRSLLADTPDTSSSRPHAVRSYDWGVITHVVMMKLHDPADRVEAATRLRSMQGQIPELLSVEVLIDFWAGTAVSTWCCGRRTLTSTD